MAAAYQIDGAPAGREAFYAAACDPAQSIVVEACAGAGKTWMLVSRILRALLDGAEPQHILAITFTRKAAGEMRGRLNEWLAEFADTSSTEGQRVQALVDRGMTREQAQVHEAALGRLQARLLASGRAVQVRTFHAWFAQLLRMAPLELLVAHDLHPGVGLLEDESELGPELFSRFQRRVAADADLRASYQALVARHGRSTLGRWLEAAWKRRAEVELADAAGTLAGAIPPPPTPALAPLQSPAWRQRMNDLARSMGAGGKPLHAKAANQLVDALAAADPRRAFDLAWAAVHNTDGDLRKLKPAPPGFADLSDELKAMDLALRQQEAHEDHGHMVALSRLLIAEFTAQKRERGLVDMPDLEQLALQLLGEGEWAGWIQERLDARLRHVLIDEFQDTSPLQWHALQPWLASYAGAGGGASGRTPLSVFIVGDPKQSIYRFRRAEPRVFAAASTFVAEALGGRRLACDHTRRNAPGVLSALNAVFAAAQDAREYTGFRPHTTEVAVPGEGVWALPREPRPPRVARRDPNAPPIWRDSLTEPRHEEKQRQTALECRHVAAAIAELLAGGTLRPQGIQVLARKRSVLAQLSDALRERHIPHVRPEELKLADEPEARDLIALLDVLCSPGHDLSLAQALKSPVFGVNDDDLLWLAQRSRGRGTWWATLQAATDRAAALERAAPWLARWAEAARLLPPHDLLDRVLHEGDIAARLQQAAAPERREHARAVVDSLLAQSLALDGGRYTTPYRFVRALKSGRLTGSVAASESAVRLLTVHGAKGLESEVVFVMDTDPEPRRADSGGLLVDWPVDSPHPGRVAFVGKWARLAPSLQPLQDEEVKMSAREELNGLYVAMTRACSRLVLSCVEPHRKPPGSAWWDRLSPLALPWQPAPPAVAAEPAGAMIELTAWPVPCLDGPVLSAARPAAVLAGSDNRATLIGEAFHRLMQWATGTQGPAGEGDDAWLDRAAPAAGAEFGLLKAELALARQAAGAVLASEAFAALRGGADLAWAGDEVPLAWDGETLRIDRLVATRASDGSHTWWVVDYKLEARPQDDPENRAQLARYREAVAALQPGEEVRAAFVTGLGQLIPLA
jgi:ATP-dependent helicase/nuclease subunit A